MALQNAALEVGRQFMTGQAQNTVAPPRRWWARCFPTALFTCNNMGMIVQTYSSFAAANTSPPQTFNKGTLVTSYAYNPGTQGDIMVVQLVYPWSVVSGPLGFRLSNLPNGAAELMGVSLFGGADWIRYPFRGGSGRLVGSDRAVAAIEFAMIMPVLLLFPRYLRCGKRDRDLCESAFGDLLPGRNYQSIWM